MELLPYKFVRGELEKIEAAEGVRVLYAVESGSRSWGFESADSDYDVRFIYVHRKDWYLSILEGRDVIEREFDGTWDICGWDLRKTLRLFRKSNPVLMEWLASPFVYWEAGALAERLRELAQTYCSRKAAAYHYLSMAQGNHQDYIAGRDEVRLKKYLYVLRPLVNILWLAEQPGLVPMVFRETLEAAAVPAEARAAIENLLAAKKEGSELGMGRRIAAIDAFIEEAMGRAAAYCEAAPVNQPPVKVVDGVFREILEEITAQDKDPP